MAYYISIRKGLSFHDEQGKLVQAFEPFNCTGAFADRLRRRYFQVMPVEDFFHLLATRPDNEIRQMAKNAGLDSSLPLSALRDALREMGKLAPEDPEEPVDLTELTVKELRAMASDAKVKGYAMLSKAELVAELEAVDEG